MTVSEKYAKESSSGTEIFSFQRFWPTMVGICLFVGLWLSFAAVLPLMGGGFGGRVACVVVAIFFAALGYNFLVAESDIVISSEGIVRVIRGKKIQSIAWSGVERITTFPVQVAGLRRNITAYNIISSRAGRENGGSRKIYFTDRAVDIEHLIAAMNRYIIEHEIRVERVSDGRTVISPML